MHQKWKKLYVENGNHWDDKCHNPPIFAGKARKKRAYLIGPLKIHFFRTGKKGPLSKKRAKSFLRRPSGPAYPYQYRSESGRFLYAGVQGWKKKCLNHPVYGSLDGNIPSRTWKIFHPLFSRRDSPFPVCYHGRQEDRRRERQRRDEPWERDCSGRRPGGGSCR